MSSPTRSPSPAESSDKKVDLITLPMTAVLISCVVGAIGYSKGSPLLTWEIPILMVVLATGIVAVRAARSRG